MTTIDSKFKANRGPQSAFWQSDARIIGYGGAMGGGKSRAICEKMLEYALEYPGMVGVIARQKHTAIVETTRKTMLNQVLPPALIAARKASMGEDYVRLINGSIIHFIGLDDPERWYSSEISVFMVDQVEECEEEPIVKIITRLRHKPAPVTRYTGRLSLPDRKGQFEVHHVADFPIEGKVVLSFNPENPGHWLQTWFIHGAQRTRHGFVKDELCVSDTDIPIGNAEFFFARVTDNPHVGIGYMSTLGALPERLRRRYVDGLWEFIAGNCFFDENALGYYEEVGRNTQPILSGSTVGDVNKDFKARQQGRPSSDPIKIKADKRGSLTVWKKPVKETRNDQHERVPAHRYVLSVDTSSGGGTDYSGIQVIDVEEFEQVAELQVKLEPDLLAIEAYRLGRIFNNALIVPETTGGWGFTLEQELKRLHYPNLYTRKILDRLTKKWTDKTGWDTNVKTRMLMLDRLEQSLREKSFGLYSLRAVAELGTFVRPKPEPNRPDLHGKPEAQPGTNDDLVMSLAIGVYIASELPRQLRRTRRDEHQPSVSNVTGY